MEIVIALLLGVVQGGTEFLPISSSGHLIIIHTLLPSFQAVDQIAFDVALHVGTLVAVVWYFWKDVKKYARALFSGKKSVDKRIAWMILIGTVPAGLAGLLLEDMIELYLQTPLVIGIMFVVVALIFLLVEHLFAGKFTGTLNKDLTLGRTLAIGAAQVLALIPGTSRSGITLVTGMVAQLSREQSARFSFLLSIPLIAAAGLKKGVDLATLDLGSQQWLPILIGTVTSAFVAYIVIKALLSYFERYTLKPFAWYRIVVGVVIIIISLN